MKDAEGKRFAYGMGSFSVDLGRSLKKRLLTQIDSILL